MKDVELIRSRAGYGFTISGQRPCLLSSIVVGSPAERVGLKQGDHIVAINGTDVSAALHETVVQLIGSCRGSLHMVVAAQRRTIDNPILSDTRFGTGPYSGAFHKPGVLRTISDDSNNSSFSLGFQSTAANQRPVSEPDMSHWMQHWICQQPKEADSRGGDVDSVFADTEEVKPDWGIVNITMVVGYLSSTELILNTVESVDDCLKAIRARIRQLGTEQDTHTLVMMKLMFDCVRLCDDSGAVLAAFPTENLVLGAVCAEDPRFFCLVTTAHIINGHVPNDAPLRASCHVFFIDPELGNHEDHMGIAGRFAFNCTPDPDAFGCLEFPQTPADVLHFVTVLYCDMGESVERLRTGLDAEAHQQVKENHSRGNHGSASSNGDSGFGNGSPPEERAERDFPPIRPDQPGASLPSCPWDHPEDPAPLNPSKNGTKLTLKKSVSLHSLSESLAGPDGLTSFYGGPPPRLEFHFKPPPPPLPLENTKSLSADATRASQRWFSRPKWPKVLTVDPEPPIMSNSSNLPPPMNQIPSDQYHSGQPTMLPPREEWTRRFLEQRDKQPKDGSTKPVSVSVCVRLRTSKAPVCLVVAGQFSNVECGFFSPS